MTWHAQNLKRFWFCTAIVAILNRPTENTKEVCCNSVPIQLYMDRKRLTDILVQLLSLLYWYRTAVSSVYPARINVFLGTRIFRRTTIPTNTLPYHTSLQVQPLGVADSIFKWITDFSLKNPLKSPSISPFFPPFPSTEPGDNDSATPWVQRACILSNFGSNLIFRVNTKQLASWVHV